MKVISVLTAELIEMPFVVVGQMGQGTVY